MNGFVLTGNRRDKAMKIVHKTPRKYMFLLSCYLSETGGELKTSFLPVSVSLTNKTAMRNTQTMTKRNKGEKLKAQLNKHNNL